MGSRRKRAEKAKDFVKPKLRVGKSKPAAANSTDVSFKSKTISLPTQSIAHKGQSISEQVSHSISLLSHHTSSTRKEALVHLTKLIPVIHADNFLLREVVVGSTSSVLDTAGSVRSALLSLYTTIKDYSVEILKFQSSNLILYIHSAMTHIDSGIRSDSSKFLTLLLAVGDGEVISKHFLKTLGCFMSLFGWKVVKPAAGKPGKHSGETGKTLGTNYAPDGISKKAKEAHVICLHKFLQRTLESTEKSAESQVINPGFSHTLVAQFINTGQSNPYSSLRLFEVYTADSSAVDNLLENTLTEENLEDRITMFLDDGYSAAIQRGLKAFIEDGGELGRSSNNLLNMVQAIVAPESV